MGVAEAEKEVARGSAKASQSHRKGHVLTTEDRRKGALKTAAIKREQSKSGRQRLADELNEHIEEVVAVFVDGLNSKDEKHRLLVAEKFLNQAFGQPAQAITGADGGPLEVAEIAAEGRRFKAELVSLAARRAGEAA